MPIIRIRDLVDEKDIKDILIPIDKIAYGSNAKKISIDDLAEYICEYCNKPTPVGPYFRVTPPSITASPAGETVTFNINFYTIYIYI